MPNFRDYTMERLGRVQKKPTYPSLNEPVLLFNRFRLYEVGSALAMVVLFGVIRSEWLLTALLVGLSLIGSPAMRKKLPPTFALGFLLVVVLTAALLLTNSWRFTIPPETSKYKNDWPTANQNLSNTRSTNNSTITTNRKTSPTKHRG